MKLLDFPNLFWFPKILSPKSFGNLWLNSYIRSLLLIITLRFTCDEKKILCPWLFSDVYFAFYFFVNSSSCQKQLCSGWMLLFISKKLPRPNLKVFGYRIWTSVKRSVKQLSSKTKFSTFCNLVVLILNWNCMKSLMVTKISRKLSLKWTETTEQ